MAIILFLCIFVRFSVVSAENKKIPAENIDSEYIRAISVYNKGYTMGGVGKQTYLFTKKSAGKYIPLKPEVTGVMYYSIPNKVKFLDENKKDDFWAGDGDEEPAVVNKDKTYYIKMPDLIVEAEYEMSFYVYPSVVKRMETGKEYISIGTGKYAYYPFNISTKCLGRFIVEPAEMGDSNVYFKIQKRISGKWTDITCQRKVKAVTFLTEPYNAVGLSKGKYRLGIKTSKEQMAWIEMALRNVKFRSSKKKSKAVAIRKGKEKAGILTWEDKKSHWYKVQRTSKNKIKAIYMYGGSLDDMVFTIYKEGKTDALRKWKIHADNESEKFIRYKRKRYVLKANGTYYIKVSKANKKTNGAYKIKVK